MSIEDSVEVEFHLKKKEMKQTNKNKKRTTNKVTPNQDEQTFEPSSSNDSATTSVQHVASILLNLGK